MSWLSARFGKSRQRIGLQLDGNVLSYGLVHFNDEQPRLERLGTAETDSKAPADSIKRILAKAGLTSGEAHWLLPMDQYRLLTVERPAVPDSEMADAIKWQIKEQIDFDVADTVLDYFAYPEHLPGPSRLYVVVAHRAAIQQVITISEACGLQLESIGISELAIGQLCLPLLNADQNIAYIGESPRGIVLNCFLGDQFAFSRSLNGIFLPRKSADEEELS
ncbi:MAG: hypothetical protein V2I33_07810, partial [Kangiellaceae bacterium]|nr:hypothetical protein [Kangiellaceae bacterium]